MTLVPSIIRLNSILPAAPAGYINVRPQHDGNFPIDDTTFYVPNLGFVDARTTITETIRDASYGKLVTFTNAAAIAVTLDSNVLDTPAGFMCFALVAGAGTATFTPSSGTINGLASIPLAQGEGGIFFFDGTNWEVATMIGTTVVIPVTEGGTGRSTLTAHAVLVGEGTSPIGMVGPGTANWPLLGAGGAADPAFSQPRGNTAVAQFADSTTNPTTGDLAKFDANGNVADAGILASAVVSTGVTLTADLPVFGAGGNAVKVGTKSGNTDEVATVTGSLTSGNLVESDASGNIVDAGVAPGALATKAAIQAESYTYWPDTGAANAYVITPSPAVSSYTAGQGWLVKISAANTAASTINVSALGTKAIKKWSSGSLVDLALGDFSIGQIVYLKYDGTLFQVVAGLSASGGSTVPTPVPEEVVAFTGTGGTLANTPSAVIGYTFVKLFRDGQRLLSGGGNDYTFSGTAITLATASPGSTFIADYYK
jgi:hypothetical protein